MVSNVFLGTTLAAAIVTYALKPKRSKTELEAKSVSVPLPRHYLPFQLDLVLTDLVGVLNGKDRLDRMYDTVKKYGRTVNFRNAGQDFILVTEPSSIQHILSKNQPNYEKGPVVHDILHDILGSGIFNADGEIWKTQRQIARPHFQTSEFKDAALINRHADELIKVINQHIDSNPNSPLEVQDLFCRFTLDEASEFLFGETVNSLNEKDSDFTTAFNYAQMITALRFRLPFWRLTVPKRRYLKEIAVLDEFVMKIINSAIARKEAKEKSGEKDSGEDTRHDNLLEHFLYCQEENNFSMKYLRDMLLNFMIAGRDTTASVLTWTIWYLVNYPDVADRLYNEIIEVLGPNKAPEFNDIKKLKYQKQVVNEVLRLRPPVPANGRYVTLQAQLTLLAEIIHHRKVVTNDVGEFPIETGYFVASIRRSVEEDVLPNGYYIPPGTSVSYSAYITHRMPEYWGEDADKFDPDRWGPERVGSIKPFMFVPFHAGPRICLGQNLAYTTVQVALTRIMQAFVFKRIEGFEPKQLVDTIFFSHNGVEVMVEKRTPKEI